jgi:hypothetical protein
VSWAEHAGVARRGRARGESAGPRRLRERRGSRSRARGRLPLLEAGVSGGEDEPHASDWTAVTREALTRTAGERRRSGPAGSACASSSSEAGAFTTALRSGARLPVVWAARGAPHSRTLVALPRFSGDVKRPLSAAAVLVACVALPAAVTAQPPQKPPKQPGNLSLAAARNPVKFGKSVTITGKLTGPGKAGKAVILSEDPFAFDNFTSVGTATVDTQGRLLVRPQPDRQHALPSAPGRRRERDRHRLGKPPSIASPERQHTGRRQAGPLLGQGLPTARRSLAGHPAPHRAEAVAHGGAGRHGGRGRRVLDVLTPPAGAP